MYNIIQSETKKMNNYIEKTNLLHIVLLYLRLTANMTFYIDDRGWWETDFLWVLSSYTLLSFNFRATKRFLKIYCNTKLSQF